MNITEKSFIDYIGNLPNCIEKREDGKVVKSIFIKRGIFSKFNISYHILFPDEKVQYNIWFSRLSYLNSNESVTISKHDDNQKFEKDKLKNILSTTDINIFISEIDKILNRT